MEPKYLIDIKGYKENSADCTAYFPFDGSLTTVDGAIEIKRFCTGKGYTTTPDASPENAFCDSTAYFTFDGTLDDSNKVLEKTIGNVFYEPRINNPGMLKTMMFSEGKTMGASQVGYGVLELNNSDGGLDYLLDYGLDGREIVIKRLLATGAIIALTACSGEQATFNDKSVSLRIKDPMQLLNVPIQTNRYGGTNALPAGVDGTSDIQGKVKPLVFGRVYNATPERVNTSRLIYQMHDGAMSELTHVYDSGVELVQGDEYATQASMEANPPEPGQYRVWLGGGMFRLGSSPAGQITCSGSVSVDGEPAIIAENIALRAIAAGKINSAGFDALGALTVAPLGIYINTEMTVAAALDQVLNSVGAWYGFDSAGLLNVGRLDAPSGTPAATLTNAEITALERKATLDEGRGLPVYKVNVNYLKNYTVQASGLAGRVNAAWENYILPTVGNWFSITYGNGLFVAVQGGSSIAATSPDGITWTQRTLPVSTNWVSVTYGNGLFVTVAIGTSIAATSPDGITWTQRTLPVTESWSSVTYGNGLFVTVAKGDSWGSGSSIAATSPDGITWTQRTLPVTAHWFSVTYGNGQFVTTADGSSIAATSPDGITWTQRTLPVSANWTSLAYGNGLFVVIAMGTSIAATSLDGITWTQRTLPITKNWRGLAYGSDLFVAVADGSPIAATSPDGITWTQMTLPTSQVWVPIAYGNGAFAALSVGDDVASVLRITPDSARQLFVSKEYRTVSASDSSILTKHPQATEITINTLLTSQADAQAEADRQLAMRKIRRDYIQVSYQQGAITTPNLGDIVQITYPRYGYDAGKLFVVIGLEIDYSTGKITLGLWG